MDDPRLRDARLEVVGSPAVNLRYGALADLAVRYVDGDGEAISGANLDWAIVGEDGGSRLGALSTLTDIDGGATMNLTAGETGAMFDVEVTPSLGDPVRFNISVSDEEVGGVIVNMTYTGTRTLVRFDALLFDGQACASLEPSALPAGLRTMSVTDIADRPAFAGLTPGDTYAVAVVARSASHLAAFGCRDMVAVTQGENTETNISLFDELIPPSFTGTYDLDNRFDFAGALPPSVEAFLDVIGELADDDVTDAVGDPTFEVTDDDGDGFSPEYGVDPGAFVTDVAMRQTCHWDCTGSDYDSCSGADHSLGDLRLLYEESFQTWDGAQPRFTGGCGTWTFVQTDAQNLVNAQVAAALPDFAGAWAQLASDLARAITNAHIESVLTITEPGAGNEFEVPVSHELVRMIVDFRDPLSTPPGATRSTTFALADAGFSSLVAEDISTVDGSTLNIPLHSFNINWGELTLYIYRNVLLREIFGVGSTGELLATWVDCNQISIWLYDELDTLFFPFSPPVSRADLESYCDTGLASAGGLIEDQLAGLIDAPGVLTISGSAMGDDIDDDTGRVDALTGGLWSGTFAEDTMSSDVTGTFTGVRARP